jgi:hypothetical protein
MDPSSPHTAPRHRDARASSRHARASTIATLTLTVCAIVAPNRAHGVKFGQDFTDTLKKKPEALKGPTYARDFEGTQIFADDLSTMYMHGLTCGACMAVMNETKTLYDNLVETKYHDPEDVTGTSIYEYMREATEPEEFCDGNVLGEKYGVDARDGQAAVFAWLRLQAVSQLRLHGQFEGTVMGKKAMMALNEYRWAIDLGLLGYDLFTLLEEGEERFDPVALAEARAKKEEEGTVDDDDDDDQNGDESAMLQKQDTSLFVQRSLKTHPYRIARQKMKLEQVCYDIMKSRPYIQNLLHHKLRRDRHYGVCHQLKKCVWKTPEELHQIEIARRNYLLELERQQQREEL